ncbi:hypothetical protein HPB50_002310 [Hyalomma asiaticum]|uniref:Uncharacterized protein n=1 Tax=Hyalomma asiaticum TaxID=266040 RepID=A0ACB7SQK3_HYAAI|nr:hypothetical protein HPB50_002310 [Hyalomma asiaticum]
MHPGKQGQRMAALSEVNKTTNAVLDDTAHETSEHNTLLWSTCRFASRQKRLSVVHQESASRDENEEALYEKRFLFRDDITGAGESAGDRKLVEGSKLKRSKMGRRRSKTVMEDLVFSIRPRMTPGNGLAAPPIGVPGCIGTVADALTYSATHFSCDVERPAERITVVKPSPGTLPYPELSTDPFSASLPCSTENAIWLPPLAETYTRGTCADDPSRTVNATFPIEASAAQSHFLRREPAGTGYEIRGPCPRQCSKSGHREAPGLAGRRYSSTETMHINRNAHDANIRANGQLQHALLKTGGANENAYTLSRQANSRKDSVLLSEVRGFKKDDDSFGFYLSNTQYQNLFDARRLLEMNKVQSLQRIAAWRENKTNVGAVTDVPERDIKGEKVIKGLPSLSPPDAHMACRIYGHSSPAGAISRNSSCGYVLEAANSHHFNDRAMSTQGSNCFVRPPLRMDGKPADYKASLFSHNNAYLGRTSLTAMSHTTIYQASHSKQKSTARSTLQVRGETPHLPNVAAVLNMKIVHCELPRYRLEDGSLQSVERQHELLAKQSSLQETGGVESITSCQPSHPPPHEPCHPARIGTTGVTRDSTRLMESVANRKDDTPYSTECLDDSLKSPVPAYSPEAAYIKYAIREDVSPCDNFYQYVCSKWERETPLSAIGLGVSTSVDTAVDEYMSSSLRDYIMRKKNKAASSARFLYNVCMASHKDFPAFVMSKIFSTLPIKTWPFNGTMRSIDVWRTAGIIARKYGVTGLLKVVAGTESSRNESFVELSLPNLLFFAGDELRPNVMRMFTQAIHEASKEFNQTSMAANLTAQIMATFKGLARVIEKAVPSSTCRVRKLKHIDYSIRTFISAVFNGDISQNTTVIVRSPDAVLGGLVRLTHNLDVQHFLNYLGFRLLVRLAALLPEHMVNVRRLFSVEFTGRVVRDDLKWFLCMRLAEAVAAPCLENVQANMFKEKMSLALARQFWLLQMEDFFSRNMRLYAWISEKSLSLMEKKMKRYKFVHVSFEKSSTSSSGCKSLRDLLVSRRPLKKSLFVPLILATWETYQEMYLKQVIQDYFPRDPGLLYEANPRLVTSLHTVYVPPGLVNASVPENSTMLAFQMSRVATRLFRTLVPLVSVDDGQCSGPSAMTQQTQRSLNRLRKCLAKDAQSLPTQLQPRAADVLWDSEGQEGEEAGFAILAQTAALGLAFAAFKEMLRVDRIWRLDFRFVPLANVSAEQLFFLYYALDNCERSDRTHRAHEYGTWRRLPAEQRVNLPLRQMSHFAEAFGFLPGRDAMAPADSCGVLRWPAPRPEIREDSQ